MDGALTFLFEKLTVALNDYVDLKAGAGFELKHLQDELRILQASLKDSANVLETTAVFKEIENQIREIVYDVEDTIDTYLTTKALDQLSAKFRTQMEKEVKFFREKVVTKTADMIKTRDQETRQNTMDQKDQTTRKAYATVSRTEKQPKKQDKVVDFPDEATVIEYLMKTEQELDVIAITGMAGVGKSTFARKILNHKRIIDCKKFEHRIWVRVSENFNREDAFLDILRQIAPKETPIPNYDDLSDTIRGCLEMESFLLVADDVWTKQDWDEIHKILPDNGQGKVLVTTRMNNVAAVTSIARKSHELKGLGAKESLELLILKVFNNLAPPDPELEEIGKNIVDKCCGVPLTILVVGGVLKGLSTPQPTPDLIEKWSEVSKNVSGILEKDEENIIKNAMALSYQRLSNELRLCFLYTGLFPENLEISTSTLTQLWVAEGFVQKVEGESLEKTAEKILDTLIDMNLLMIIRQRQSPDQVKTCRVHDMMRGFCRAKAKDENLFREISKSDGVFDPSVSEALKFRRVCFNSDPAEFLLECSKVTLCVRSFLCFSKGFADWDAEHISIISKSFNKLRVLNCKFINFQQFPSVKGLKLLKHVIVSIGNLDVVPEQISQLVNLETLIVLTQSHSIRVKANIWKMIQLRRLKTKAAILLDDKCWKGSKSCTTLQTISRLSHESCKASIPERAPNLKVLAIQGKVADLFNTLKMEKLGQLEKLKLVNDQSTASDNPLLLYPQHCFPPMLKSLTLSNTYLKWKDHMPILTKIDSLKVLKLKDNAFTGIDWDATVGGFPRLRFLLIENTKLVNWKASTAYFPSLTWLVVKNCKELQTIPRSLGKHLEKLEIERVNKSVVDAAKDIESDIQIEIISNHPWWKVPLKLTIGPRYGYLARQPRIGAER